MADRRYDEKEVAAILKRAAEIQAGLAPDVGSDGMTLPDLQRVATEVGLDPVVVQRAADEIATTSGSLTDKQNPNSFLLERTVDGVLTEESWDDVVTRLRRHVGKPGRTTIHGNTYEWTGGWDTGLMTLSASVRDGRTRFKLMGDTTGGAIVGWTVGSSLGLFLTIAVSAVVSKDGHNVWLALGSGALVALASILTIALSLRGWRSKARTGMEVVFDDVTKMTVEARGLNAVPAVGEARDALRESLSNS